MDVNTTSSQTAVCNLLLCFLQSILAPVLASCSLFGLYLLIKYLPNFSLQTFLDAYFWLLGTVAVSNAARPVISKLSSPLNLERFAVNVEVPPGLLADDEQGDAVQNVLISPADVAAVLLGMGLATYELLGHHTNFTLNNMVSCSHLHDLNAAVACCLPAVQAVAGGIYLYRHEHCCCCSANAIEGELQAGNASLQEMHPCAMPCAST